MAWVFLFPKLPVSAWTFIFKEEKASRKNVTVEGSILRMGVSEAVQVTKKGQQPPLTELSQWLAPPQAWAQLSRRFYHRPPRGEHRVQSTSL